MASINATKARKEFFALIKDTIDKHRVFHIHHRKGDVVLMSGEEYESLQETLELLSIPGFRASITRSVKQMKRGETLSLEKVFGKEK